MAASIHSLARFLHKLAKFPMKRLIIIQSIVQNRIRQFQQLTCVYGNALKIRRRN